MVKYSGINHLAMTTKDMDTTIRFWRDLLSMRLVAGLGRPGYRHYFFEISEHDMIAFFEWTDVQKIPEKDHGVPVKGPFVFDHVSFEVEEEQDLWELKDRLETAGFWVSEVVDHGFIHSIYTFDPNGIPLEFSYNLPDIDVRAKPFMKDKEPVENANEGSEPVSGTWPKVSEPTPESQREVFPGVGSELYHYLKHLKNHGGNRL